MSIYIDYTDPFFRRNKSHRVVLWGKGSPSIFNPEGQNNEIMSFSKVLVLPVSFDCQLIITS